MGFPQSWGLPQARWDGNHFMEHPNQKRMRTMEVPLWLGNLHIYICLLWGWILSLSKYHMVLFVFFPLYIYIYICFSLVFLSEHIRGFSGLTRFSWQSAWLEVATAQEHQDRTGASTMWTRCFYLPKPKMDSLMLKRDDRVVGTLCLTLIRTKKSIMILK